MSDLDRALADIVAIRTQLARGDAFCGFGPSAIAATGVLALGTTLAQHVWLDDPTEQPLLFLGGWIVTALASAGLIGAEMRARSRRDHAGLTDTAIVNAVEQFLPAGAAGACLALVLVQVSPESLWMLPGLWQMLVSLGLFASVRSLPKGVALPGAWYMVAGLAVLMLASADHILSPWTMGLPFAVGQFLMAMILYRAREDRDA
ncbi:hypothetical protein ASF24_04260 [Methylobacterium sp. Leaf86]|uniref:hypothetical protein n=1 Tax=Methylobacterium sp. Leaf86 TaxID=1736242 RepID=UPI0006F8057E|nr:hypothetical protein [Methylobacterium sp. Leaf86]KQO53561.1 hypothetical protein ASF24_04260 [Methylobacterium sp. Leaf86]